MSSHAQSATIERTYPTKPDHTAPVNLIRGTIDQRPLQRWMADNHLQDPDHAIHCLLRESFGQQTAPKPYRVMNHTGEMQSIFYGYSEHNAEELRETALFSQDPVEAKILPPQRLESKLMPSDWKEGQRVSFEVRARMSMNTCSSIERATGDMRQLMESGIVHPKAEYDLMVWERCIADLHGAKHPTHEEVYSRWMSRAIQRSGAAALENDQIRLVALRSSMAKRKREEKSFLGTDAVMRGSLIITEPGAFSNLLARGVGRHRSYGYGMMLLGPPARA